MAELSGRFVLRVPPELHRCLRERARAAGISLNVLCMRLLEEGISSEPLPSSCLVPGLDPALLEAVEREWSSDLVGIALFGSAARGKATQSSDVDLLLVLERTARIERSLHSRWDRILKLRGRPGDGRVSPQFLALPGTAEAAGGYGSRWPARGSSSSIVRGGWRGF